MRKLQRGRGGVLTLNTARTVIQLNQSREHSVYSIILC